MTEEVYVCGIRINFDVITNFENETFHYDSQFFIKLFLQDEKFHSNDTFNHHHFLSISRDNYQPNVPKKNLKIRRFFPQKFHIKFYKLKNKLTTFYTKKRTIFQ